MVSELIRLIPPLFIVSFFLNLLWEVRHSTLYTTCHEMPFRKYVPLILTMSVKDAFWIVFFYSCAVLLTKASPPLSSLTILIFIIFTLSFSFIDEWISVRRKRWEYAPTMPRVFGVGISPLFELAVTGGASLFIVSRYISL